MFKKSDTDYTQPEPTTSTQPRSNPTELRKEGATIGPSITIKGDLSGDEDLMIQGRVEGKIDLKQNNITIGKNGRVKADVYGKVWPLKTVPGSKAASTWNPAPTSRSRPALPPKPRPCRKAKLAAKQRPQPRIDRSQALRGRNTTRA